jgi:hypothetical protein
MREQMIINRIALLQSRKADNGNIVAKLERELRKIRAHNKMN